MLKAILTGLIIGTASASVAEAACPVTYTFSNGTTADATQVNQDFSDLTGCVAPLASPSFSGSVGIGMVPSNILDITQTHNGDTVASIFNGSTGAVATSKLWLGNAAGITQIIKLGSNYTTLGVLRQDGSVWYEPGAGGITLNTASAHPIYFAVNNAEVGRFDPNGYLLEGYTTSNGAYRLQVNSQIFATSSTIATSDRRLKRDLGAPDDSLLRAVEGIQTHLYVRKDHPEYGARAGYWAQDWMKTLNGAGIAAGGKAGTSAAGMVPLNDNGYYGLDEGAVQALKIAALEREVLALKDTINGVKAAYASAIRKFQTTEAKTLPDTSNALKAANSTQAQAPY